MKAPARALAIASICVAVVIAVSIGAPAHAAPQGPGLEEQIRAAILARRDAAARGDLAAWSRGVADDSIWTADSDHVATKAQVRSLVGASAGNPPVTISGLQVRRAGTAAVATYVTESRDQHNGKTIIERNVQMETYARRAGRWVLVAQGETWIPPTPADPPVSQVDATVLDRYVGVYEWSPKGFLEVYRDGERLMARATGQDAEEMFAEDDHTFFGKGQRWRQIFPVDATGTVRYSIFRDRGIDYEMPRVK